MQSTACGKSCSIFPLRLYTFKPIFVVQFYRRVQELVGHDPPAKEALCPLKGQGGGMAVTRSQGCTAARDKKVF